MPALRISTLFCYLLCTFFGYSQNVNPDFDAFQKQERQLANGLRYQHWQLDSLQSDEPWSIHILEVDLLKMRLELCLGMDQITGQEVVSSMVERKGALAGINGGFSFTNNPWNIYRGDPQDVLIKDSKLLSEPHKTRASFGWLTAKNEQIPVLAQFSWSAFFQKGYDTLTVHGLNRLKTVDETILYTPEFSRTTLTPTGTLELVLSSKFKILERNTHGSNPIPKNGYVLSIGQSAVAKVQSWRGKLQYREDLGTPYWFGPKQDLQHATFHTAGPILMLDGKAVQRQTIEQIPEHFVTTRHPRTGVGISQNRQTVWLVVVDGRQPQLSVGMSLPELTTLLVELGAWEAYNLDGGGSSTMVVENEIVNSPSDGKERLRCDGLLVLERE